MAQLKDFIKVRKLFSYGAIYDYFDHANCIAWTRSGDEEHPGCAVVMSNGDDGYKTMDVGKEHAGATWSDLLGWYQGDVTIGQDGTADFHCHGMSVSIYTANNAKGRDGFGKK